jgi:archaellum biogenesis ATPase FlaH
MSSIFNFLQEHKLSEKHFCEKLEFYIPDFLAKGLITMIYADGGQGKSYLSLCLANTLLYKNTRVVYLDFDNPLSVLRERGADKLIENNERLDYIQRSSLDISPLELLIKLSDAAISKIYNNCIFIIDSIRNFVDITNDGKVMQFMNMLMSIRDAGGTIVLLHHANKDGRNYQGSNNIRNSVDCMYFLKKHHSNAGEINISLTAIKERTGVKNVGFCLNLNELSLTELDINIAQMSDYEESFVSKAKQALVAKALNKTQLLSELGYEKDDKTAREVLDKFEGIFWNSKKEKNAWLYYLPTTSTTFTTSPNKGHTENVKSA